MPTNLLRKYNALLELLYSSYSQNKKSLQGVFDRDFRNNGIINFNSKPIQPTPALGVDAMDRLFWHLISTITDEATKKREFESERAIRIHWIRFHLEDKCPDPHLIFKIEDEKRVYILNTVERYVIILEPLRDLDAYYLITAYHLENSNYRKIIRKAERRGQPL